MDVRADHYLGRVEHWFGRLASLRFHPDQTLGRKIRMRQVDKPCKLGHVEQHAWGQRLALAECVAPVSEFRELVVIPPAGPRRIVPQGQAVVRALKGMEQGSQASQNSL